MSFSWQCKIISSCLCMLYFWNILNFSVKVAWVNRTRKRFILMITSLQVWFMPHSWFASLPSFCLSIFNNRYSNICLFPKTVMLITYHLPKSFKWKKHHRGYTRHNLAFHCISCFLFVLRAKTRFWYLSCSAPSLINYLKKLLPSKVMFLMIFLVV